MKEEEVNEMRERLNRLNLALSVIEPVVKGEITGDDAQEAINKLIALGYSPDGEDVLEKSEEDNISEEP